MSQKEEKVVLKKDLSFESLSSNEVLEGLKVNQQTGLSVGEAEERLTKFGKNKLVEKKKDSIF